MERRSMFGPIAFLDSCLAPPCQNCPLCPIGLVIMESSLFLTSPVGILKDDGLAGNIFLPQHIWKMLQPPSSYPSTVCPQRAFQFQIDLAGASQANIMLKKVIKR